MKTLGAYFQVYKNKKATEFVLSNFRCHYPENPVIMISDGGDDFEDLAKRYSTGYVKLNNIFTDLTGDTFYDSARTIEAWRRHKLAVDYCKTDYIIILEDDVLVQRRIDLGEFDIRGVTANNIPPEGINEIVRNNGHVGLGKYGACGGCVYSSFAFKAVYDSAVEYTRKYHNKKYFSLPKGINHPPDRKICALDCNIVFHFTRMGYKYENAEWLSEVHRQIDWASYPIVHQYKEHY